MILWRQIFLRESRIAFCKSVVKTEERLMNYWVAVARNYRRCYIERQSAPGVDESSDESSLKEASSSGGEAAGLAAL